MENSDIPFLSLTGIPAQTAENAGDVYFYRDPQGAWYPSRGNHLVDIDAVCVRLRDAFEANLFGGPEAYRAFFMTSPEFLSTAGMNSEAAISKDQFVQILSKLPPEMPVNKALYLYDCRKLISGVQECSKETLQLQGEFYQVLNLEELFYPKIAEDDGVRIVTSPVVTKLYALLGAVYIRLHSLLDYVTKLAIETEGIKSDFETYPLLASKNRLYSDRKKVSLNHREGTLFEACNLIAEIEAVRNHLIHDGLLDERPKAYRVIAGGVCLEKFILFPDRSPEGRFAAYKNRNLFYGKEDKINIRLPDLVAEFQVRLLTTLKFLLGNFENAGA